MSTIISNIPYTELTIGQSASMSRTVSAEDIALFAAASHDTNPGSAEDKSTPVTPIWENPSSRAHP